jgi:broad specificity phosphatase PhoE
MSHSSTTSTPTNRLLVVRHGESEWNVLGKWQGRADTLLTDAGRDQARAAAERLITADITVDCLVASTLRRARETAEIIAATLGLPTPLADERLVETDVGPWEGLREHEIEAGWPNHLRDRRTPPEFEPAHVVFDRVSAALREHSESGQRILIVSHSGVIRTVRRLMNAHDRRLRNLEGCTFHIDELGNLVAGDFVSLSDDSRATTNDSV